MKQDSRNWDSDPWPKELAIVGGAGFVGTNMALEALDHVDRLDIYDVGDRLQRLAHSGLLDHPAVHFHQTQPNLPLRLVHPPDVVINLAAWAHVDHSLHESRAVVQNNVMCAVDVLEEARRLGCRVIFASSVEVYGGNSGRLLTEESVYRPLSPYAATKVAGEAMATAYAANFDVDVCVIRLTNLYGPWQSPDRLVPRLIAQQLSGLASQVESGRLRDFVHVQDACRAFGLLATMDTFPRGQVFNIASEVGVSNERVGEMLKALTAGRGGTMTISDTTPRDGRGASLVSSSRKLRRAAGWMPRTELFTGLSETVAWYQDNQAWWGQLHDYFAQDRTTPHFMVDYPTGAPVRLLDVVG